MCAWRGIQSRKEQSLTASSCPELQMPCLSRILTQKRHQPHTRHSSHLSIVRWYLLAGACRSRGSSPQPKPNESVIPLMRPAVGILDHPHIISTCVLLKDATIRISSIAKYSQVQTKSVYRCLWWRWSITCWWWAMQDWLHKDHSIHYEMEIPSWKQPHTFLKVLRSHLTPWILAACCWKGREKDAFSSRRHLFEGHAAVVLFCYVFFGGSPHPKSQPQTLSSQDTTPPRSCSKRPAFTRSWPEAVVVFPQVSVA